MDAGSVLEGPTFRQQVLDDTGGIRQEKFDRIWEPLRVLARCSPNDKLTIVRGKPHFFSEQSLLSWGINCSLNGANGTILG